MRPTGRACELNVSWIICFKKLVKLALVSTFRRFVQLVSSFRRFVKPIGIFTHVLMNFFFGTKIHMFLNILIVLGNVGTVVMPPVLKLLILLRLSHNLKSRRVFILNG